MKFNKHPFLQIAGICMIAAPLILFAGDVLFVTTGMMFEWTIALWLAFTMFIPAIAGLSYLLFENGKRLALAGGIFACLGASAGASMQALFRAYAVLYETGGAQTVELLRSTGKLVVSTQVIGITFPVGMILIALSLYRSRLFNSFAALALALGTILFPVGRIFALLPVSIVSDAFLAASLCFIGFRVLDPAAVAGSLSYSEI